MNTIAPLLTEAERYLGNNDLDRAAECYVRAFQLDGDRSPLPTTGLARVAMLASRRREATILLDEVIAKHPRSAEALTFRGVLEDAEGRQANAMKYLTRAIAVDARYVPAQVNFGRVCAQLGKWREALIAFRAAQALAPTQIEITQFLAIAAARCGEFSEALTVLTKHLQRSPNDVDALVTLADVLVEAKKMPLAAELLANAIGRISSSPALFARQSAIAFRMGDLELARSAVAKQLALTPNDHEASLYAASLDLMKLDFASAEGRVLHVLGKNPRYWRAHYQLGMIYEAMRLFSAARVAYRMAISNGPKAWQPLNNLAVLLLEEKGGAREAKVLLQEALALGPAEDTLDARYNLALACFKLGEVGAAERAAREVAASPKDLPVVTNAKNFLKELSAGSLTRSQERTTQEHRYAKH